MLAGTDNLIHDDISQFYEIPASKNSLKIHGIKSWTDLSFTTIELAMPFAA